MSEEKTIMVVIAEHKWTMDALHEACSLARKVPARIVLVAMIPVSHPAWLGTDLGYSQFSPSQAYAFAAYQETLEDYQLPYSPLLFQYVSLLDAIGQVSGHLSAEYVFAHVPKSHIPFWQDFQVWSLQRKLARQGSCLIQNFEDVPIFIENEAAAFQVLQGVSES